MQTQCRLIGIVGWLQAQTLGVSKFAAVVVGCACLNDITLQILMSCPSWQWHRPGSSWFTAQTLPVAPLCCDTVTWDSS